MQPTPEAGGEGGGEQQKILGTSKCNSEKIILTAQRQKKAGSWLGTSMHMLAYSIFVFLWVSPLLMSSIYGFLRYIVRSV